MFIYLFILMYLLSYIYSIIRQAKILNSHPFLEYIELIITKFPKFYDHVNLSLLTYR